MYIGNVNQKSFAMMINILQLIGIFVTLIMAFALQIWLHELPCPLCLLQRVGFLSIAFGFLLNLRFGMRPSHYAVVILSAIYTSFVALRQIALHVIPGSGGYGSALFGLHLYTWSFIVSMSVLIVTAIILGFDQQYSDVKYPRWFKIVVHFCFSLMVILIGMNIVSVLLECGLAQCPDNPVRYLGI